MNLSFEPAMLDHLFEAVMIVDQENRIQFWNKGATRITGFTPEETIGLFCHDDLLNPIDVNGRQIYLMNATKERFQKDFQIKEMETYIQHKKGHRIPVKLKMIPYIDAGKIVGTIELFIENNEINGATRKIGSIENKPLRDKLTGLANKVRFEHELLAKMNDFDKMSIPFGVLMADIDNFEGVNSTYGRERADELLKLLAECYRQSFKLADMIGRWQNDEFVFLFTNVSNDSLKLLSEKIRVLSEASAVRGGVLGEIDFTVSVGGSVIRNEDDIEKLLKRVSERLKKAKSKGGNSCVTK